MKPTTKTTGSIQQAQPATGQNEWEIDCEIDGAVILRHEASGEPTPTDWRERLVDTLKTISGVGLVGVKRIQPDGKLHSMGENVIHPKGFHSVGRSLPAPFYHFPVEADAVTSGVIAVNKETFEKAGGVNAISGGLGALQLSLSIRRKGFRCMTVPDVKVEDCHVISPTKQESDAFNLMFGFDWQAANLDDVKSRHRGNGLLWNSRFFSRDASYGKYKSRPFLHWKMLEESETYKSRAQAIVRFISAGIIHVLKENPLAAEAKTNGVKFLDFGCGDGLFSHLFATGGFQVTGIDIEEEGIEQAKIATSKQEYDGNSPKFILAGDSKLPFDNASFDTVMMLDVIEHLPNPVAVLGEIHRILKPGAVFAVSTPEAMYGGWSDALYHVCEYEQDVLNSQLVACGFDIVQNGRIGQPYRDLLVIAKKR